MRTQYFFSAAALGLAVLLSGCETAWRVEAKCTGNCINGTGTLTYMRTGQTESGAFTQGLATGMLTIAEKDGRVITVPAVNGVPHGLARIRTAGGQEYEQTYAFGLPVKGRTVFSNGDVYEGSFKTVVSAGGTVTIPREGSYTTAKGTRYKGRFDLVADQLVFMGRPRMASPLPTGSAPFTFAALDEAGFQALQAQQPGWAPLLATQRSADPYQARFFASHAEYYEFLRNGGSSLPANSLAGALAGTPSTTASLQPAASPALQPAVQASSATFQLIEGNTGLFMSPFTSDGVAAGWVDKALNAQLGGSLGAAAGAYAGQKALEQVPFVGGFLGGKVGKEAGRSIALKMVGGEQYMRETSDISFNDMNEMARWLVVTHGQHPKFAEVMKATYQIYPDLKQAVMRAQYATR